MDELLVGISFDGSLAEMMDELLAGITFDDSLDKPLTETPSTPPSPAESSEPNNSSINPSLNSSSPEDTNSPKKSSSNVPSFSTPFPSNSDGAIVGTWNKSYPFSSSTAGVSVELSKQCSNCRCTTISA